MKAIKAATAALILVVAGLSLLLLSPAFPALTIKPFTGETITITAPAMAKMNDIFDDLDYEYAGSLYGRIDTQGAGTLLVLNRFDLANTKTASPDHIDFTVGIDDKYAIVHSHPNGVCAMDEADKKIVTELKTKLGPQSNLRYTCIQCATGVIACYDIENGFFKVPLAIS